MSPSRAVFLYLGLSLSILVTPASASLLDVHGLGGRATGLGGAVVAGGYDFESVYYNPANLLNRKQSHIGLGFTALVPNLHITRAEGDGAFEPRHPDFGLGAHLGVAAPIGGVFKEKLAFGAVLYHPLTSSTRLESIDPAKPYFYRHENLSDKLLLALGLAGEPVWWLRVGLGLQLLAELSGTIHGSLSLEGQAFTSENIDLDVTATAAPTAGLSFGPFYGLRIGVVFRTSLALGYKLPIAVVVEELGLLSVTVSGTTLYTPNQLSAGMSWTSSFHGDAQMSVEAGFTWEQWSHAPPPAADFSFILDDSAINADSELSEILDVQATGIPLGARDTWTARLGIEVNPTPEVALRTGYQFRPTPLPLPIYQTNTLEMTSHIVSFGLGYALPHPDDATRSALQVDLAAQVTALTPQTVEKDPEGTPSGSYRAAGAVFAAMLDLRHDF